MVLGRATINQSLNSCTTEEKTEFRALCGEKLVRLSLFLFFPERRRKQFEANANLQSSGHCVLAALVCARSLL